MYGRVEVKAYVICVSYGRLVRTNLTSGYGDNGGGFFSESVVFFTHFESNYRRGEALGCSVGIDINYNDLSWKRSPR